MVELFLRILTAGFFFLSAFKIKSMERYRASRRLLKSLKSSLYLFSLYNILLILSILGFLPKNIKWMYNIPKLIAIVIMTLAVIDFVGEKSES